MADDVDPPKKPATRRRRGRGASDPNSHTMIDAHRRQDMAYKLYMGGRTSFEELARTPDPQREGKTLYADRGACYRGVQAAIKRHNGFEETETRRTVTLARLDTWLRVVWPVILRGGPGAAEAFPQAKFIFEEMARITGIHAPRKQVVQVVTNDTVDEAITALVDEMNVADAAAATADELGLDDLTGLSDDDLRALLAAEGGT